MIKAFSKFSLVLGLSVGANFCVAQEKAEAMVMLDYQVIPVPGSKSIDLMGFHLLNKMNDWMYLGIGGYAPLFKGEYGGFMAVDVTAHVQSKIVGNLFADAGVSLGGGGGGKSVQQSKVLSGTGGFVKGYVGLGYDFKDFSAGANYSKFKFKDSAIDHSQLNVYLQVPFSYAIGAYGRSGDTLSASEISGVSAASGDSGETILSLGLDNFFQRHPEGSNKDTINVADLQFSHFMTKNSYWYVNVGVGYHGLPLYNQILAGVGYRTRLASNLNLYSQLAIGSGGYAPDTINTGPGVLVYPKLSAEYMVDKNLGFSLSAGYLYAPQGSSKNYTLGAALNYHINSLDGNSVAGTGGNGASYRGYRVNLFQQTEASVKFKGLDRDNINLLTLQADAVVSDNIYIPVQVAVAYNAYLGYPGYGELLAGVGLQSKYRPDDRFQLFGQLLVGTNVHGPVLKTGVGANFGVSDRLAIYGVAGQTYGVDKEKFKSNYVGLGMSYRFSVPSW